jgi:hypothetical protein
MSMAAHAVKAGLHYHNTAFMISLAQSGSVIHIEPAAGAITWATQAAHHCFGVIHL